jgi:hypothetical protein
VRGLSLRAERSNLADSIVGRVLSPSHPDVLALREAQASRAALRQGPARRHPLFLFLITLTFVLLASVSDGKIRPLPLNEMVKEAELIVIGKVVSGEKTREHYDSELVYSRTKVAIKKTLKGDTSVRELYIYTVPVTTDARFQLNEESILFIHTKKGKNSVVRGYGGKVDIKGDMVGPITMINEPREQKLEVFMNKIEIVLGK